MLLRPEEYASGYLIKTRTIEIMNSKQFYSEMVKLRRLQKEYFKTRSSDTLRASKKQEKLIDDEIERVDKLIQKNSNPNLFGHETD